MTGDNLKINQANLTSKNWICFSLGNLTNFHAKLDKLFAEKDTSRILAEKVTGFKALALWRAGYYADGLKTMDSACEYLLNNLENENARVELGTF